MRPILAVAAAALIGPHRPRRTCCQKIPPALDFNQPPLIPRAFSGALVTARTHSPPPDPRTAYNRQQACPPRPPTLAVPARPSPPISTRTAIWLNLILQ